MDMLHDDSAEQRLREITSMVATIARKVAGSNPREALDLIVDARDALAGPLSVSLPLFDAATITTLLGPERAAIHVRLVRLEGSAYAALGDRARARARAAWARTLERAIPKEAA